MKSHRKELWFNLPSRRGLRLRCREHLDSRNVGPRNNASQICDSVAMKTPGGKVFLP